MNTIKSSLFIALFVSSFSVFSEWQQSDPSVTATPQRENPCLGFFCVDCDLEGFDFTKFCKIHDVSYSVAWNSNLNFVNGENGKFNNTSMFGVSAIGTNFKSSEMNQIQFTFGDFRFSNFAHAVIDSDQASKANFKYANFNSAKVSGSWTESEFDGADFTNADLSQADFSESRFGSYTKFSNTNVHGLDLQGYSQFFKTDLSKTNLVGMAGVPQTNAYMDWSGATCPDGTSANSNGIIPTCIGHFIFSSVP